jgi:hypothetical protein
LKTLALAGHVPVAVGLNQPGTYLQWNVFTISVANLVLIAVMVVIFGAALLLPFPAGRRHDAEPADAADPAVETAFAAAPGDERTARVRRRAMVALPPGKLLPDRQPAYVASWAYVFGVASVAALGVPIVRPASPAWSPSSPRSWSASPGTCPSRISTPSGYLRAGRTRSTRSASARSST